jgi:hypothetical protein
VRKIEHVVAGFVVGIALSWTGAAHAQPQERCTMPRAPAQAIVALVGTYEGQAVSSAAAGGLDRATTLAFVDIAPGDRPLYVVLTSYDSMIWVFRGATERVAYAVLYSAAGDEQRPAVGAVGLPASRVRAAHGCINYFYRVGPPEHPAPYDPRRWTREAGVGAEADGAVHQVQNEIGRDVDVVIGHYGILSVALPSGLIAEGDGQMPAPEGFHRRTWTEAMRFHSGGLVQVNPTDVVGIVAEAYDVRPDQMGLAQLTGAGQLQYMGGFDRRGLGDYRIVEPIPRFPAELAGAHAARFLIEPGVPMPPGDPGHSCVIFREGPRVLEGGVCDIAG